MGLQETNRMQTEKTADLDKECKRIEQTFIKFYKDQREELDSKIKIDINKLQDEKEMSNEKIDNIIKKQNSTEFKLNNLEVDVKDKFELLENSAVRRSEDLETALSKYHEQALTNSDNIKALDEAKRRTANILEGNLKDITNLQETIVLQTNKIEKVNVERQEAAVKDKEEFQATVLGNAEALDQLKNQFLKTKDLIKTNIDDVANLKEKVKENNDHIEKLGEKHRISKDQIKHIDDTLDGMNRDIKMSEERHVETVQKMKEVTTLANNIGIQVKENEQKLVQQSSNDLNQIKEQIQNIENQSGISSQKITELDKGSQSLLEKILGLEKGLTGWVEALGKTDVDLLNRINSLKSENANEFSLIKNDHDQKMNDQTKSVKAVEDSLSKNIEEAKNHQKIAEKNIEELNAGAQKLNEKLLGIENDIDDKMTKNTKDMKDKYTALDAESKQNLQSFVTLQESINLQSEKVQKVDAERQQAAAQVKEEFAATVITNAKAIADMKAELEDGIKKLEEKLKGDQLKDNSVLEQKLQNVQETTELNTNEINDLQTSFVTKNSEADISNKKVIEKIIGLEKEVEKEFAENKIQLKDNNENIEAIKQEFGKNIEDITSLNKTHKNIEDQIKHIDDTLNGINSSVSLFENRHIETVEKIKDVTTLASNIEIQV